MRTSRELHFPVIRTFFVFLCVSELDASYPPYGYAELPLDTLPLDPELHETYIPDMTYDPRQAYPEPL